MSPFRSTLAAFTPTPPPFAALVASMLAVLFAATVVAPAVVQAANPSTPTRAASSSASSAPNGVRLRRFALMAGFNDGGPTRPQLRYATSDAQAMSRVLESLGGVAPDDVVSVSQPTRAAFLSAFERLARLVTAGQLPGVRREVVVYYSGHSDEDGLLIGADRVSYEELRTRIQAIPAEVRLAILDSCASGAFTRRKGGVRRAPFLMDASADTKGHAYLASSAINEVAQESDRIGASFFTHYLVSGLRGAADVNRDRRVTLQEAFQFAAQETLARTETTRGGPQHAAYEFDLVGTSDLVVTDVRSTQATLALASDLSGRIGVRDAAGNLVVELRKMGGHGIELGLEAGPYVVTMDGGAGNPSFEATVTLALGQRAELERLAFHPGRPLEVVATRGGEAVPGVSATAPTPADASGLAAPSTAFSPARVPLHAVPVHLGLVPQEVDATVDVHGLSFSLIADRVGGLSSGLQLSMGANVADQFMRGTQLTIGANILRGPGRGAQLAVGFNFDADPFHGAALAAGANVALADFTGAQLTAGANWVEGPMAGAQLAAGVNVARGGGHGAQLAGGLNLASLRWRGAQLAGGANLANDISGAQLAPINLASSSSGLQLGVANLANDETGAQIGVINLARRSRGFKLGVVNFANSHDGDTLGLVNIVGNGIHDVAVYATDSMLSNVALELGSRHIYTSYIFGYHPGDELAGAGPDQFHRGTRRIGYGLGVGYRQLLDLGRLRFLTIEGSAMSIMPELTTANNAPLWATTRALVGIEIYRGLTAIVGLSYNATIAWDGKDLAIGTGFLETVSHSGTTTIRQYPGLLFGFQI
jgi:Caspase domain